jgi:lipopolysaccharide exporter
MRDVVAAVGHTAVAKILMMLVQFAATTILARNLTAADYGVVGFATGIVALLIRVNGLGLSRAVIRSPQLEPRTISTAATLNTVFSIAAFVCAQAAAPLAGLLLNSPPATLVVRVLAFRLLLSPIGFLSDCVLSRELRFGELRIGAVLGVVVRGIVSVSLALTGWKYWSLVIGILADVLVGNTVVRIRRPVRFHYSLDRAEASRLLAFGVPLTVAGLASFAVLNADNLAIGSLMGATTLGYYTIAFTWAIYGSAAVQEVVQLVLYPKFSQMQDEPGRVKDAYLRVLRLVTWAVALVNISLLVVADGFLVNWLGQGTARWLPAAPALQVLCIYGIVRASVEATVNPLLAFGNSTIVLKAQGLTAAVELLCLPLVVLRFGIEGVAVLVTVAYAVQYAVYFPFLRARLDVRAADLVRVFAPVLAASIVGTGLAYAMPGDRLAAPWSMVAQVWWVCAGFLTTHEFLTRGRVIAECRAIVRAVRESPPRSQSEWSL